MIYSAIMIHTTIISDYSEEQGDFQITITKLLKANKQPIEFYVVPFQSYDFYFLHKDDYTFSCMTTQNLDNEKILLFLQTLKEQFLTLCKAEKDNLTLKTTKMLMDLMVKYFFKKKEILYRSS
jgi:hypothetical protein